MNLDKVFVADIEADALLEDITKIHVLSYGRLTEDGWKIDSTNNYEKIKSLFTDKNNVFVMHNGQRYDKPAIEKVLGIEVSATVIDSLAVAWWVYPERKKKFGLEEFGEEYGVPKPKVQQDQWRGLSEEELSIIELYESNDSSDSRYTALKKKQKDHYSLMKLRCSEDVKINIKLWVDLKKKLRKLYDSDEEIVRLINLLNFIMKCSLHQELQKVKVDVAKTKENLAYFEKLKEEKLEVLKQSMPKNIKRGTKTIPKVMYKKDGSLSVAGVNWLNRLRELELPLDTKEFEDILSEEEPNPNSTDQKKAWLYSLGWEPETFDYKRDKKDPKKPVRIVPQILTKEKELCPSVLRLIDKEPAIGILEGLTVLTHRIGTLKGFLDRRDENDMISQGLSNLAVTMRWQHAVIVNIPRVTGKRDLRDGVWLRECLIAQEETKLVQADLSGIESRTSDHYTFKLNPDRITKTQQPYFDEHTEISVVAKLMTPEEEAFYVFNSVKSDIDKSGGDSSGLDYKNFSIYTYNEEVQKLHDLSPEAKKEKMQILKNARSSGKTTNYSCKYKVGSKTLSRTLGVDVPTAQKLIDSYWDVHWAVKNVAETFKTKKVDDETWIFNPVSKFWYYLRNEKDKFSVVNSGTAVYIFNLWVLFVTKRVGFPITQTHDDLMLRVKDDDKIVAETMNQIKLAMEDVNNYVKLNVKLDCEVQNGYNFAETH